MKSIILSIFLFSNLALSNEKTLLSKSSEVTFINTEENSGQNFLGQSQDIEGINQILAQHNLMEINDDIKEYYSPLGVDQIYTDPDLSKAVFLKLNRKPADEKLIDAVVLVEDSYLLNIKSTQGFFYVLYFIDFQPKNVIEIAEDLNIELKNAKLSFLEKHLNTLLLPQAEAGIFSKIFHKKPTQSFPEYMNQSEGVKNFRKNLRNVQIGIRDCVKIFVEKQTDQLKKKLIEDPKKIIKGTHRFVSNRVKHLGDFFTGKIKLSDLKSSWKTFVANFKKISYSRIEAYLKKKWSETKSDYKTQKATETTEITREQCSKWMAIGAKSNMAAVGFFLTGNISKAWDTLDHASSYFKAEEALKEFLE